MDCKLVKEVLEVESKQNKGMTIRITNFYLVLSNGEKIKVLPNSWEDSKGVKHSNTSVLSALATDIKRLPF